MEYYPLYLPYFEKIWLIKGSSGDENGGNFPLDREDILLDLNLSSYPWAA